MISDIIDNIIADIVEEIIDVNSWQPSQESSLAFDLDFSDTEKITESEGVVSAVDSQESMTFTKTGSGDIVTNSRSQNDLNVLDFPTSDNWLEYGSIVLTRPFTIAVVSKSDLSSAFRWAVGSSESDHFQMGLDGNANEFEFRTNAGGISTATKSASETAPHILVGKFLDDAGDTMQLWVDGVQGNDASQTGSWDDPSSTIHIGTGKITGASLDGWIGQVLLFLGDVDADQITTYLNNKWAIF